MAYGQTSAIPMRRPGGVNPAAVQALCSAVTSEVRLLEDLIAVMRRQREAVGHDDLQAVDDSVFSTHRVLVTLGEARRRRHSISQLLGAHDSTPLRRLPELLGDGVSDELAEQLRFACDGLHAAALVLAREVELNRTLLREALAAGDNYVRNLYGEQEPKLLYGAGKQRTDPEPAGAGNQRGGYLVNRTA